MSKRRRKYWEAEKFPNARKSNKVEVARQIAMNNIRKAKSKKSSPELKILTMINEGQVMKDALKEYKAYRYTPKNMNHEVKLFAETALSEELSRAYFQLNDEIVGYRDVRTVRDNEKLMSLFNNKEMMQRIYDNEISPAVINAENVIINEFYRNNALAVSGTVARVLYFRQEDVTMKKMYEAYKYKESTGFAQFKDAYNYRKGLIFEKLKTRYDSSEVTELFYNMDINEVMQLNEENVTSLLEHMLSDDIRDIKHADEIYEKITKMSKPKKSLSKQVQTNNYDGNWIFSLNSISEDSEHPIVGILLKMKDKELDMLMKLNSQGYTTWEDLFEVEEKLQDAYRRSRMSGSGGIFSMTDVRNLANHGEEYVDAIITNSINADMTPVEEQALRMIGRESKDTVKIIKQIYDYDPDKEIIRKEKAEAKAEKELRKANKAVIRKRLKEMNGTLLSVDELYDLWFNKPIRSRYIRQEDVDDIYSIQKRLALNSMRKDTMTEAERAAKELAEELE